MPEGWVKDDEEGHAQKREERPHFEVPTDPTGKFQVPVYH